MKWLQNRTNWHIVFAQLPQVTFDVFDLWRSDLLLTSIPRCVASHSTPSDHCLLLYLSNAWKVDSTWSTGILTVSHLSFMIVTGCPSFWLMSWNAFMYWRQFTDVSKTGMLILIGVNSSNNNTIRVHVLPFECVLVWLYVSLHALVPACLSTTCTWTIRPNYCALLLSRYHRILLFLGFTMDDAREMKVKLCDDASGGNFMHHLFHSLRVKAHMLQCMSQDFSLFCGCCLVLLISDGSAVQNAEWVLTGLSDSVWQGGHQQAQEREHEAKTADHRRDYHWGKPLRRRFVWLKSPCWWELGSEEIWMI